MHSPLESALPFVAALALCALRWLPSLIVVPVFAGHALSGAARAVIALALALPAAPGVAAALAHSPTIDALPLLAAKETGLGIVLAGFIAVPFWAIEAAGTYLDYQRGGNPQALDPAASVDASVLGAMLQQALVVFLIHTGGMQALLNIVYTSFALWPALAPLPPLGPPAWQAANALLAAMTTFALSLACPYLLALGAIEACFALLSRVNAKFPAYVAALPFKSVVLLLLVTLTLPRLLGAAHGIVEQHLTDVERYLQDAAPPSP